MPREMINNVSIHSVNNGWLVEYEILKPIKRKAPDCEDEYIWVPSTQKIVFANLPSMNRWLDKINWAMYDWWGERIINHCLDVGSE